MLASITIPASVTCIGKGAFYNCTKLASATFEDTDGWYVTNTEGASSGTDVYVANNSTAAKYLVSYSYYRDYYWYKG